jgi:type IV pilus assembly protein PilQ
LSTFTSTKVATTPTPTSVAAPSAGYSGLLGGFFPAFIAPTVAGVTGTATSASNFNFLSLNKAAGGRTNIATVPMGLNLSVNLLLQQNKAKLLANPSVVVSDNTEALVTLAQEVIHKVTSTVSLGVTNVNVELTKAGIFLDVLPKCTDDGFIYMRIRPQVSAPLGPPQTFANQQVIVTLLNIREILAQEIRVKDGQTLVLGGLFTEQEASQISKVPYLAETPLFGALFRNTLKGRQRTELMLMITPKIVEEQPGVPGMPESPPAANL